MEYNYKEELKDILLQIEYNIIDGGKTKKEIEKNLTYIYNEYKYILDK